MAAETTDDIAALKADLARIRDDMARLSEDLRTLTAAGAATARRRAGEEGARLHDEAAAALDRIVEQGSGVLRDAAAEIGKRPVSAALVALLVGFLLGRLLDRRG